MMLSNEDIIKFQTLYKERFGIVLSTQDAYEKGMKVLRMMSIVYRPITKKQQSITLARKKYLNQKINSKNA